MNATAIADDQSSTPNRAFSGKRLTIVLLLILASTGGLFYWVTLAYSSYNASRRQTDREWRNLASQLETRYRLLDTTIAAAAEGQAIDKQLVTRWRSARDQFTGTGLTALQTPSAEQLESVIMELPTEMQASAESPPELLDAVKAYDLAASAQRLHGQSVGSKMLKIMLNLPDPIDFELAR